MFVLNKVIYNIITYKKIFSGKNIKIHAKVLLFEKCLKNQSVYIYIYTDILRLLMRPYINEA